MKGELLRLTNGATIGTIGLGDVKELSITQPAISEQKAIIDKVFSAKKRNESTQLMVSKSIEKLEELRAALITAAVNGRVEGLR
jgi:type I restriction enzyme S subunit